MKALTGHWLLGQDYLDTYLEHSRTFEVDPVAYEAFLERRSRGRDEGQELFIRQGTTAHIPIVGVLTAEPDFFFDMFGGGSAVYGDIVAAISAAEGDGEISRIVLEIDSPGGETSGFMRTAKVIAATSKPITAEVTNMAASAAFGLAAQADSINVEDSMAMVGSVGVATTMFVNEFRIQIASTEAPNKRPDVTTEEGVAAVRLELDALHAEFAGVIASGRDTTVADVNANFGRGGLVIAADALQAGMIDGISKTTSAGAGNESQTTANTESDHMDLSELKAKHPELHAQVKQLGVDQERDRVTAHVEAGKAVGRPELAAEFIVSGSDFTSQVVQSKYMTAGINKSESDNRQADDTETDGVKGVKSSDDRSEVDTTQQTNDLFDQLEADMGIERKVEA